jgi:hypothetical protein
MRALAEYALRGRWQAVLVALLFTFIPLFGWVGVAIMALVTLRKGSKEGFFVLVWIVLPVIVGSIVIKDYRYALFDALLGSTVVWLMAIILRNTNSWLLVLQGLVAIALSTIIIIHIIDPNIYLWWQQHLAQIYSQINLTFNNALTPEQSQIWVQSTAKIASGLQAVFIMLTNLFNLALARWAQALLFNPGGLKKELHYFRLDRSTVIIVMILSLVLIKVPAIQDSLPVLILPFICAGFSLIHYYCDLTRWDWLWLLGFYFLFFALLIYAVIFLILIATADVWLNFRQRFVT